MSIFPQGRRQKYFTGLLDLRASAEVLMNGFSITYIYFNEGVAELPLTGKGIGQLNAILCSSLQPPETCNLGPSTDPIESVLPINYCSRGAYNWNLNTLPFVLRFTLRHRKVPWAKRRQSGMQESVLTEMPRNTICPTNSRPENPIA